MLAAGSDALGRSEHLDVEEVGDVHGGRDIVAMLSVKERSAVSIVFGLAFLNIAQGTEA
jgi:hypothetical protein